MKYISIRWITAFILFIFANGVMANIVFPSPYNINDWHCIKNSPVTCIAVGSERVDQSTTAVLLKSIDGGKTWQKQLIVNAPTPSHLLKISCAWDGSICAAIGRANADAPFIVQSIDLNAWKLANIKASFPLELIACTGDIKGPLCVAAGHTFGGGIQIIQTKNRSDSWEMPVPYYLWTHNLPSLSCAGNANTARCLLYFNYDWWNSPKPAVFFTYNGGETWTNKHL